MNEEYRQKKDICCLLDIIYSIHRRDATTLTPRSPCRGILVTTFMGELTNSIRARPMATRKTTRSLTPLLPQPPLLVVEVFTATSAGSFSPPPLPLWWLLAWQAATSAPGAGRKGSRTSSFMPGTFNVLE